jgi:hypothetical protein
VPLDYKYKIRAHTHTETHTNTKPPHSLHSLTYTLSHPPSHSPTHELQRYFCSMKQGAFGPMEACKRHDLETYLLLHPGLCYIKIGQILTKWQRLEVSYFIENSWKRFRHEGSVAVNVLPLSYEYKINTHKASQIQRPHALTHSLHRSTHPPTHSLTNFNAISVNEAGRFWAHGGLQKTDLETY